MTLVFLDTETTGLNPDLAEIWEIAYAIDDGPIVSAVVPHDLSAADPKALELNGYMTRGFDAEPERDFELGVRKALEGATIVGSNPAFDTDLLFRRWGVAPWHHRRTDLSSFAKPAFGEMLGLYKIAELLGVEAPDHTAAGDVRTLRECYRKLDAAYAAIRPAIFFRERFTLGAEPIRPRESWLTGSLQ